MSVTTSYRVHVQGQIRGLVAADYIREYVVETKPETMEEVHKIVDEDFLSVKGCHVEEITVTKRLIKLQ